ncbi:SAFB-like transcription modulator isoform X2 [Aphis craccivora]|uniref:SAFB-like transcription modulator isoform X2 n=1 Tax=Aphis craccivora TaxID=307492 RepID=A0A6G0XZU3_APHCR|nr:SAFB-like transcription modulator isoform X2 [Aphis craccivora]
MLTLNSESLSVEKNEIDTTYTSDKKKVTPPKIIKTNEGGRRSGPKSSTIKIVCLGTCVPLLKTEKTTSSLLKKNEVNPQQAGSNNVDLTDTVEAKSKKINIATKEKKINEDRMTNSLINSVHTDNVIVKIEKKEIKLTTNLYQFDNGAKFDIVEENTIIRNHLEKEKNESIKTKGKEVTPEPKEDEDNIHDEELDHEMYEELDHEFDEEEIIESNVGPNQTDTVSLIHTYQSLR